MAAPRRRTAGFTLIELLVVIAIIGVLIALLLPAVQAAREAARRMQCTGNLKQIGIALHNYHDTHATFPAGGWIAAVTDPTTKNMNIGWSAVVLPGLEQRALYDGLNLSYIYDHPSNSTATHTVLAIYLCPSEPRGVTLWNRAPGGAMIFNQTISLAQITDGASQTIQIGEDPEAINAMWASGHNVFDQAFPINTRPPVEHGEELTSQHPGGVNVLFADGSVHFLKNSISTRATAALCTRSGGETVSADEY
jgi:prepilin-type N-terminal cleavage/methylation domain-containing protein/prepilin-type processing-associated H-X9-DG protein